MASSMPIVSKKTMQNLSMVNNDSLGGSMSSFARRQMEKMGWTEGKGLGKNEDGLATYIRVKKREENVGLGTENVQVEAHKSQWWYNVYDRMADKIKVPADDSDDGSDKSKKKKKKKSKSKSKRKNRDDDAEGALKKKKFRVPTDEELFQATGGKLFGRRAYGSCTGKLKRDLKQVQTSTGTSTTLTEEQVVVATKVEEVVQLDPKSDKKKKKKKHKSDKQ